MGSAGKPGMKRKCPESSSTSSSGINHDVFLNFRGADTRVEFTDVLRRDLENAGVVVFHDEKSIRAGEKIDEALKDAIKGSRISIAIFSEDYASSRCCLMELVQMWECSQSDGQTIIPVFYNVTPYEVKNQAGAFAKSFVNHVADGKIHEDTINTWKEVLRLVGGLSGVEREKMDWGRVTPLLERVLKRVRRLLRKDDQLVTEKLVGIDLHVQEVMKKLGVVSSDGQVIGGDVRVVRICGMRGVGKTTLAKVVFNKIHLLFQACCFLESINSQGVVSSQETLIAKLQREERQSLRSSDDGIKIISSLFGKMKVLIVLDDVRNDEQIKGLAGKVRWFGPGSRIIVTTHKKNVLKGFDFRAAEEDEDRAAEEYNVNLMGDRDALHLFYKHAFRGGAPPDVPEYVSLSRDIVAALGGLPMAIVLRAEYLKKRENIEIWRNTRDSLNDHPEERDVQAAFKDSYVNLDDNTREIFLDIACFFNGKDERIPSYMWGACGYRPPNGIELLRDLHLLEDGGNNELRMNDLIREIGRDMVLKKDSFARCRFWNHKDASPVLKNCCAGTESVPGIGLCVKGISLTVERGCFTCEEFRKMLRLKYLRLDRANIEGNTENLPPDLRWLDWRECHSIPKLDDMKLEELVILDLSWSPVTKDSQFWGQIREKVKELKVLNLQGCVELHPSLVSPAPINLEMLILEDCYRLIKIRPFIRNLRNLSSLNLRKCRLVTELPAELYSMESLRELLIDETGIERIDIQEGSFKNLETLSACGCKKLEYVSAIGHLMELKSLALDGAPIDWHEETYEFPHKLQRLSLRECRMFDELQPSIENLTLLEEMDLSYTGIAEMPPSVKHLSNLKKLKMEGTYLEKFPEGIVKLEKLEEIDFSRCKSMKGQHSCDLSGLSSLRILRLASSNVAGLPESICHLSRLETLDVSKCKQLQALPELPCSLLSLCWGSKRMDVPKSTNLKSLKELSLIHDERPEVGSSNQAPDIGWITELTSLETLELSLPNVTNLPGNLSALTQLRKLTLSHMKELDLAQLALSSSLWTLCLKHCEFREPKFSGLNLLSELDLKECNLAEIDGLKDLTLLEVLKVSGCSRITNLNGLKDLRRLRKVQGIFSARPSLPEFSHPVELDIITRDPSPSVA